MKQLLIAFVAVSIAATSAFARTDAERKEAAHWLYENGYFHINDHNSHHNYNGRGDFSGAGSGETGKMCNYLYVKGWNDFDLVEEILYATLCMNPLVSNPTYP